MTKKLSDVEWIAREMWAGSLPHNMWEDGSASTKKHFRQCARRSIRLVAACKQRKKYPRAARIATLERELADQHRAHLAMRAKATEACSAAQARNEHIAELETVLRDLLSAVAANAVSTPLVAALAAYYAQRVLNGEKP